MIRKFVNKSCLLVVVTLTLGLTMMPSDSYSERFRLGPNPTLTCVHPLYITNYCHFWFYRLPGESEWECIQRLYGNLDECRRAYQN